MTSYVIVPGIGGSGASHWQSRWEDEWGTRARRIQPNSWDEPNLENWAAAVETSVGTVEEESPVVVVAHSLGCWAVAHWASRRPHAPAMLLVAPPNPAAAAFPRNSAPSFLALTPAPLPGTTMVVASSNDPYADITTARELASAWGAQFREVGARGHLNGASGLEDWPQGRGLLVELERMNATQKR